jgi:hypothetical protein
MIWEPWLIAGVYLYVNTSAADMGAGPILESPIFHPPPCYHSGNNPQYYNSCMVSTETVLLFGEV